MKPDSPEVTVLTCHWQEQQQTLSEIRRIVFIEEQSVPEELEWDGEDEQAWHFLACADDNPVGAARLLPSGQIGRMCVFKPWRRQGIGRRLLHQAEITAGEHGISPVFLHAQTYIRHFYEHQGYSPRGNIFMDAGIPHIEMVKPKP